MLGRTLLLMSADEMRERTVTGLQERRIGVTIAECAHDLTHSDECPDVVVVELGLAGEDGASFCVRLREDWPAGLIALGNSDGPGDAAEVLRAGADDFMAHPQSADELIARVRSLLRRLREYCIVSTAVIDLGEITVYCDRHEVTVRGKGVALTPKEFDLLLELARGGGELIAREALLAHIWGCDDEVSTRTLDVHVGRLRKKIERDPSSPRLILTVPRVGYRLAA